MRDGGFDRTEHRSEIRLHNQIPTLVRNVLERSVGVSFSVHAKDARWRIDADIREHHVQFAVVCSHGIDPGAQAGPVRDIEGLAADIAAQFCEPPYSSFERRFVPVHQGHARAVVGHDLCIREPDAARRAGHDRDQSAHVEQFRGFHCPPDFPGAALRAISCRHDYKYLSARLCGAQAWDWLNAMSIVSSANRKVEGKGVRRGVNAERRPR